MPIILCFSMQPEKKPFRGFNKQMVLVFGRNLGPPALSRSLTIGGQRDIFAKTLMCTNIISRCEEGIRGLGTADAKTCDTKLCRDIRILNLSR